ncbi:uncharacterized protein LOC129337273 isoform X2 [Eublepharis macularius]|uniref:Uncharacterized protein LOC129337273 isoform X2 n=1 Tax=Eublepharis macularius TaxID=481883 RepID=A0AA97K0H4_EUBMA|nr:uncharacterized protein LOC129337273 isoform X2 [Eublepharis macularius]
MGYTTHRPLRHGPQQAGPAVLLPGRNWPSLPWGCLSDTLVPGALLCLPALSAHAQGPLQDKGLQHPLYPDCPTVAPPGLVPALTLPSTSAGPGPVDQGRGQTPQCGGSEPGCLAPVRSGVGLSSEVLTVILNARKPSTRLSYQRKWSRFSRWLAPKGVSPFDCPLPMVLDYLLYLCSQGLAFSSIKVHMAAISAFHEQIDGKTVFTHWLSKQFLKGLFKTFPPRAPPIPQWSLSLVLSQLMLRPFEPLSTCPLALLTQKVAFLVAVTSSRRVGELSALRCDPPFLQFFPGTVMLHTSMEFLPKVVSKFHLQQKVVLPSFFPTPSSPGERALHTLDVKRALLFYLHRTKCFRKSPALFLCYSGPRKGSPASAQSISRWIVSTIKLCYQHAGVQCPLLVTAHSTRAQAASAAFLRGVPLRDVCQAATWSTADTFIKHYSVDVNARRESAVGTAVLHSLFQ